jgi:phosphoribosylformylglycinamidine cyclo-ligase
MNVNPAKTFLNMYNPTKPYKQKILEIIESTWQTPYVNVRRGIYPTIEKKFSFLEVQHTDGIGTKGMYHWKRRTFKNAVLDALAMNLNDLAMVGATPYALQNNVILPNDDHSAILDIIRTLARECRKRKIAITGGETSIHNNIQGMDISITISGFVKLPRENKCQTGDVLIGLRSGGLHSNGFTLVRDIFRKQHKPDFIKPTFIYIDTVLPLLAKYDVNGMMHITGGAFTKIKDVLGKCDLILDHTKKLRPQKIFYEIYKKGVPNEVMYSAFNCGIGFILSAPPKEAKQITSQIGNAHIIGEIVPGKGLIKIQSAFNGELIEL